MLQCVPVRRTSLYVLYFEKVLAYILALDFIQGLQIIELMKPMEQRLGL